jgi:ubiquinone/menaquinone biosynthesis C-methylase UbiE
LFGRMADRRRGRLVRSLVSKEMEILDLGCGSGWLVEALRREGYKATGIDPNLPHANPPSYLLKRSAYETGFADNSFDCLICLETIEHLEPRVYTEINRVSKNRGRLLVTTPKKRWNWLVEFLSCVGLSEPLVTPHINLVDPHDIPFDLEASGSFMLLEWYGIYTIRKQQRVNDVLA